MTLAEFLAKEGAIYKFIRNVSNCTYDYTDKISISTAFGWGGTPEGNRYWFNMAGKQGKFKIQPQRISEIKDYAKQFKKSFKEIQ